MLNLKVKPESFATQKLFLWLNLIPLILSLSLTIFILLGLKSLPSKLPLFYSLPWGDDQLVTHQELLFIPVSIIVVTLLNIVVSWQLHPSQSFFKKMLLFSPLLVSLLLTVSLFKIVVNFI